MRVMTLHSDAFGAACLRLEAESRPFMPDLVVGIANGGVHVAERMFAGVPHASVRCRRVDSDSKDRAGRLFGIVRKLPVWMRDLMRKAEALMLARRGADNAVRTVECGAEAASLIAASHRILVVDDAVDSGHTLQTVLGRVHRLAPEAEVRTAALTVTTPNPVVRPDYCLYRNGTLIRFTWSNDYTPLRKNRKNSRS